MLSAQGLRPYPDLCPREGARALALALALALDNHRALGYTLRRLTNTGLPR